MVSCLNLPFFCALVKEHLRAITFVSLLFNTPTFPLGICSKTLWYLSGRLRVPNFEYGTLDASIILRLFSSINFVSPFLFCGIRRR